MKNPSRRWVSQTEFDHFASALPRKHLARLLHRCDRTIRDWQSGRRPIPAWAVQTLKLHALEHELQMQQMQVRRGAVSKSGNGLHRGGALETDLRLTMRDIAQPATRSREPR